LSDPRVEELPGGLLLAWEPENIIIEATHLRQQRGGRVEGEIRVLTTLAGARRHLTACHFDFSSQAARTGIVKRLEERLPLAWDDIFEQLCIGVIGKVREGEPVIELWPSKAQPPSFLLEPLIIQDMPTVIYGEPGKGKSIIAHLCAILLKLWGPNDLRLATRAEPHETLYLDWESSPSEAAWQHKCLLDGLSLPYYPLLYRRCIAPLAEDIEEIHNKVISTGATAVILDSLAGAAGGDLNKTDVALPFWAAHRQLGVSSLIIAHEAKNPETKKRSIYGNTFFTAYSRSVWQIMGEQEQGSNVLEIGLRHVKFNPIGQQKPLGYRFTFLEDKTLVEYQNPRNMEEMLKTLSLRQHILLILKNGAMDVKELHEAIEPYAGKTSADSLARTLRRMRDRQEVVALVPGQRWGLAARAGNGEAGVT